jgi:hypothetical protein
MREAIEQGRRGYTMAVNEVNTAFHMAYWLYLQKHHPRIVMARPKNRGSKSSWIILKGHGCPKGVHMHHKFDQHVMEIGYAGRTVDEILAARSDWPDDIRPVQKSGTASLSITVPAIEMKLGIERQIDAIELALEAAYRLMPFATLLQSGAVDGHL